MAWIRAVSGRRTKQRLVVVNSTGTTTGTSTTTGGTAPDTTPEQFIFADVTGASLSAVQVSNPITVSGLSTGATAAVTVTGGEMQRNGGGWTTSASIAANDDTFSVRHTSSSSNLTSVSTTLTIGGVSDTFTSTTVAPTGSNAGELSGLLLAITRAF